MIRLSPDERRALREVARELRDRVSAENRYIADLMCGRDSKADAEVKTRIDALVQKHSKPKDKK